MNRINGDGIRGAGGPGRISSTKITWLILLLGLVITAFGITYGAAAGAAKASVTNQIVSGITLSAGGGIAGAAISLLITAIAGRDVAEEIREIVARSFQARLISEDAMLDPLRIDWHQYYVTQIEGRLVWRYSRCQFGRSAAAGTILVDTSYRDSVGKSHRYRTEAGVWGNRGIVIDSRVNGAEQPSISVFPQLLEGYKAAHAGLQFMVSWDGVHLVSKIIMSKSRLVDGIGEGSVPDDCFGRLDSAWETDFMNLNKLATGRLDFLGPAGPGGRRP